jgi:multidrug efflux pump
MAQVLVQNRVSLALPVIPLLVQNEGISVKKMSPNTLMIVNLVSPDRQYDATFLSNYATIYIRDELGRLPGVAGITYLGQRDYSLRVWLDPGKLASLGLSSMDVVTAIAQQNIQVAAGQIGQQPVPKGQQFQLTINTLGRLTDPEQFADIIVKAGPTSAPAQDSGGSSNSQPSQASASQSSMNGQSGSNDQASPPPQAASIVRLRDVVIGNQYHFRIHLDAARLAKWNLKPADFAAAVKEAFHGVVREELGASPPNPRPRIGEGGLGDTVRVDGDALTWVATIGGPPPAPLDREVADTMLTITSPPNPPPRSGEGGLGGGVRVRLGDLVVPDRGVEHLAQEDQIGVELGSQQYDQSCTLDGEPSVALSIYQLPGSNALDTAKGVYAKMKELKKRFPDGLDYQIVYDTTPFINESVDEVYNTLRDAVSSSSSKTGRR